MLSANILTQRQSIEKLICAPNPRKEKNVVNARIKQPTVSGASTIRPEPWAHIRMRHDTTIKTVLSISIWPRCNVKTVTTKRLYRITNSIYNTNRMISWPETACKVANWLLYGKTDQLSTASKKNLYSIHVEVTCVRFLPVMIPNSFISHPHVHRPPEMKSVVLQALKAVISSWPKRMKKANGYSRN